jgi:hypothetical protein
MPGRPERQAFPRCPAAATGDVLMPRYIPRRYPLPPPRDFCHFGHCPPVGGGGR